MLEVADIATAYGKIEALRGVSLSAEKGRLDGVVEVPQVGGLHHRYERRAA